MLAWKRWNYVELGITKGVWKNHKQFAENNVVHYSIALNSSVHSCGTWCFNNVSIMFQPTCSVLPFVDFLAGIYRNYRHYTVLFPVLFCLLTNYLFISPVTPPQPTISQSELIARHWNCKNREYVAQIKVSQSKHVFYSLSRLQNKDTNCFAADTKYCKV